MSYQRFKKWWSGIAKSPFWAKSVQKELNKKVSKNRL